MWAQGLTIGVLIAAGALTHSQRVKAIEEGPMHHQNADHSWRDILEHEEAYAAAHSAAVARQVPALTQALPNTH